MTSSNNFHHLVALNMTGQIGRVTYQRLLTAFGSSEALFRAAQRELERVPGIGPVIASEILRVRQESMVERELKFADRLGVQVVPFDADHFPAALKNLYDHPLVLYIHGTLKPEDQLAIGVVGSRLCSPYGKQQAERFGYELAEAGLCVVSGLARGVDTLAHSGALKARGGRTVAFLGSGLNRLYPPENRRLYERIVDNGAVISEFPLDARPEPSNFPRRNRLISGLSLGVLVIEAGIKSGALITTDWALEQNKEVFCLPGRVDNPMSRGCHAMIKQGAKLVETVEDILEELPACQSLLEQRRPKDESLQPLERVVYHTLRATPLAMEEIAALCRMPVNTVERILDGLIAKGKARLYKEEGFVIATAGTGPIR